MIAYPASDEISGLFQHLERAFRRMSYFFFANWSKAARSGDAQMRRN
jgi:hypothetical protein